MPLAFLHRGWCHFIKLRGIEETRQHELFSTEVNTLHEVCNVMAYSHTTDGVAVPITIYVPSQANNFVELPGQSLIWQGRYMQHIILGPLVSLYLIICMYISIYAIAVRSCMFA